MKRSRTSAVTIYSSTHGRKRRKSRGIEKSDLHATVLRGKREPALRCKKTGAIRWKYTFAGIVYITDESSTKEITSWAQPMPALEKSSHAVDAFSLSLARSMSPVNATSHVLLVVDRSGSMTRVEGHQTRTRARRITLSRQSLWRNSYAGVRLRQTSCRLSRCAIQHPSYCGASR